MRDNDAVRLFTAATERARTRSTFRLRLWLYWLRRRLDYSHDEADLICSIVVRSELGDRARLP